MICTDVSARTISVDGLRVRMIEAVPERERDEPVLLIHGLGGWAENWSAVMPAIAESGRRAIAIDLPGFGESERARAPRYFDADAPFYRPFFLPLLRVPPRDRGPGEAALAHARGPRRYRYGPAGGLPLPGAAVHGAHHPLAAVAPDHPRRRPQLLLRPREVSRGGRPAGGAVRCAVRGRDDPRAPRRRELPARDPRRGPPAVARPARALRRAGPPAVGQGGPHPSGEPGRGRAAARPRRRGPRDPLARPSSHGRAATGVHRRVPAVPGPCVSPGVGGAGGGGGAPPATRRGLPLSHW